MSSAVDAARPGRGIAAQRRPAVYNRPSLQPPTACTGPGRLIRPRTGWMPHRCAGAKLSALERAAPGIMSDVTGVGGADDMAAASCARRPPG